MPVVSSRQRLQGAQSVRPAAATLLPCPWPSVPRLGASGARLMTSLLSVLEQTGGRYGLQTMCGAGGTANATIVERL